MNRSESLRVQAGRRLSGETSEEDFRIELSMEEDIELLRSIAEEFTPHFEVSVPVYRRLLEINPADPGAFVELGFVHWLCGEDSEARNYLAQAYRLEPSHAKALLLDAALEPDSGRKRKLYKKVLEKDPGNQIAVANLREMDESSKG